MPFTSPTVTLTTAGPDRWTLCHDLVYEGAHDRFVIPAGFVTDGATVPAVVTWLIPVFGAHTLAAVLHDWCCVEGIAAGMSPRDADGLFRRTMREAGVPPVRRWLAWTGVRWGALANPRRRAGWWRDAPAVLGITVLAAPIVVPGAVLALAGLSVYSLAELAARVLGCR